ncbi:MAG: hypothetical protein AB7G93_07380 [Bdellovibrionales bacterium]
MLKGSMILVGVLIGPPLALGYEVLGLGFNAPTVQDHTYVTNPTAGEIVYDSSDDTFYGYKETGSWTSLSGGSSANAVTSGGTGYKIEKADITISCAGSVTYTNTSSSWISAGACSGTGKGDLTITGFSAAPTCVCSAESDGRTCSIIVSDNTSVTVTIYKPAATAAYENGDAQLICMGPAT